jgi:hypothetical protein
VKARVVRHARAAPPAPHLAICAARRDPRRGEGPAVRGGE